MSIWVFTGSDWEYLLRIFPRCYNLQALPEIKSVQEKWDQIDNSNCGLTCIRWQWFIRNHLWNHNKNTKSLLTDDLAAVSSLPSCVVSFLDGICNSISNIHLVMGRHRNLIKATISWHQYLIYISIWWGLNQIGNPFCLFMRHIAIWLHKWKAWHTSDFSLNMSWTLCEVFRSP